MLPAAAMCRRWRSTRFDLNCWFGEKNILCRLLYVSSIHFQVVLWYLQVYSKFIRSFTLWNDSLLMPCVDNGDQRGSTSTVWQKNKFMQIIVYFIYLYFFLVFSSQFMNHLFIQKNFFLIESSKIFQRYYHVPMRAINEVQTQLFVWKNKRILFLLFADLKVFILPNSLHLVGCM